MKIIIFLLIFKYILSPLTEKYYTSCKSNSENIINPSSKRCKSFSSKKGHCCYIYHDDDWEDTRASRNEKRDDSENKFKTNSKKMRKLFDFDKDGCIGLSNDGYNHIEKVIEEIQNNTDDNVHINCEQKGLKLNLLFYCLVLLYSLLLLIY